MLKYSLFLINVIIFLLNPTVSSANYTFNDSFDTNEFNSWITIPNHVTPIVSNVDGRTVAKFYQDTDKTFSYIGKTSQTDKVVSVHFDFYYKTSFLTQGAGFMLTKNVPTSSKNPPNDTGDYSIGIWPIQGSYYLLSPLCDGSFKCNLSINNRAIFKINPDIWNTISIEYYIDGVDIKLNNISKSFAYSENTLPKGFFFGNSVFANTPQTWMDFFVDNFYSEFGDLSLRPSFPFVSQMDSRWASTQYDTASEWAPINQRGIDRWGCALSSATMVLRDHNVRMIDGSEIDPLKLNDWLIHNDGYIGPGLVNWIALTRFAKESFDADNADTKLEFVRTYSQTDVTLPAILGIPGHFVVAHGHDDLDWIVNDPAERVADTSLPMTTTIKSVNRFIPSNTDLSYLLFTTQDEIDINLTDENGVPTPLRFYAEYLTDDLGGSTSPTVRTAMIPKPQSGRYTLEINNEASTAHTLDIYLYDIDAAANILNLIIPSGESSFLLEYDKLDIQASAISPLDTTPPSYMGTTIFDDWYNATQSATFNYSDANLRDDYVAPSCQIVTEGNEERCTVTPRVCDKAGNCNPDSQTSDPAKIDFTPPTSYFTLPTTVTSWDGKIMGTATDNLSGIQKVELVITKPDNTTLSAIATGTSDWQYTLTSPIVGQYTIQSIATDNAQNTQAQETKFVIANILPVPKLPNAPKIVMAHDVGPLVMSAWSNVKEAKKYRVYLGTNQNEMNQVSETRYTWSISRKLPNGKYYLGIKTVDKNGIESKMSRIVKVEVRHRLAWWRW